MRSTARISRSTPYRFHRERRATLRISESFPVRARSTNGAGYAFDEETFLSNLSAGGLYLTLLHRIEVGERFFALMRLSPPSFTGAAPCVAARGTVLRVHHHADNTYGIAVKFSHHRFL